MKTQPRPEAEANWGARRQPESHRYASESDGGCLNALHRPATRPLALAMLGTIRLQQGNTAASVKLLEQALALNPKLVGARTTLGNAYAFSGNAELAAKCFRQVLKLDPSNFDARY